MSQPEDLKKGLECCADKDMQWKNCEQCSYGCFGRCSNLLHEDALEYIQYLEEQIPHWISVEDRLPKDVENVLVFCRNGEITWANVAHRLGTQWWRGGVPLLCVTHWMPLPEPPKEGW